MADAIGYGASVGTRTLGGMGAYTLVTGVTNIVVPALETELVENTHLTSTGRIRTFVPGMVNAGQWSFECNATPAQYATLKAFRGVEREVQITWPDTSTAEFNSTFVKIEHSPLNMDLMKITVTGQVSGEVTFTPDA